MSRALNQSQLTANSLLGIVLEADRKLMRTLPLLLAFVACPTLAEEIRLPLATDPAASRSSRTFQDRQGGFSVVIPEGWARSTDVRIPGVAFIAQATAKERAANCNVRSVFNERFLGISGAKYFKKTFPADDPSELLATYKASGLTPTMLRAGRITISGTQGMFVEIDFARGITKLRTFNVQFLQKGRLYTLGCTDLPNSYSNSLPEFGLFISSFRAAES